MLKFSDEGTVSVVGSSEVKAVNQLASLDSSLLILTQSGVLYIKSDSTPPTKLYESESSFITCFDAWRGSKGGLEGLVVGLADGSLEILNKLGHVQKAVKDAHKGAVTTVKVSHDGQSILSSSEDCTCKLFSRNGMLRNELNKGEVPVYGAVWTPDNSAVALAGSKTVAIRKIAPSPEVLTRVCEGAVLFLDFSSNENLILAGGEDCRFAVMDFLGRVQLQSAAFELPFVCGRFVAGGAHFILANAKEIVLAERKGGICHRVQMGGGMNCLAVARDCPQFWVGTLDGRVLAGFALLFEPVMYKNYRISLKSESSLLVEDLNSDFNETMELPGPPSSIEIMQDRVLVATPGKLFLANLSAPAAPTQTDVSRESFAFARLQSGGVAVGFLSATLSVTWNDLTLRAQGTVKVPLAELSRKRFAASEGWMAWVDPRAPATISVDCVSQKAAMSISHSCEVIALSYSAGKASKKLLVLDTNHDLHLVAVPSGVSKKVASLASSFMWHETLEIFAWVSSGNVNVALAPSALSFDPSLFKLAIFSEPLAGPVELKSFYDATLTLQKEFRVSGQVAIDSLAVKLLQILEDTSKSVEIRSSKGLKLAQFVKNKSVWAVLASFCLENRDTSAAEVALAALSQIDKVQFLSKLNAEESPEIQQYLFFMLNGKTEECEKFLLSRKKPVLLVKTLLKQFEFQRALEIAQSIKAKDPSLDWLVDLTIHRRKKYLEDIGFKEEFVDVFKVIKPTRSYEEVKELKKANVNG